VLLGRRLERGEPLHDRPGPRRRVTVCLHYAAIRGAQHELRLPVVDRVVVDVKAVHLGRYRRSCPP
jgi:hypothetical protein